MGTEELPRMLKAAQKKDKNVTIEKFQEKEPLKRDLTKNDIAWMRLWFDKNYHTTVKWRKGGAQPDKIKTKLETRRTIDFIFYNNKIKQKAILSVPHYDEVEKRTNGLGLPSWQYPSDHFM